MSTKKSLGSIMMSFINSCRDGNFPLENEAMNIFTHVACVEKIPIDDRTLILKNLIEEWTKDEEKINNILIELLPIVISCQSKSRDFNPDFSS